MKFRLIGWTVKSGCWSSSWKYMCWWCMKWQFLPPSQPDRINLLDHYFEEVFFCPFPSVCNVPSLIFSYCFDKIKWSHLTPWSPIWESSALCYRPNVWSFLEYCHFLLNPNLKPLLQVIVSPSHRYSICCPASSHLRNFFYSWQSIVSIVKKRYFCGNIKCLKLFTGQ